MTFNPPGPGACEDSELTPGSLVKAAKSQVAFNNWASNELSRLWDALEEAQKFVGLQGVSKSVLMDLASLNGVDGRLNDLEGRLHRLATENLALSHTLNVHDIRKNLTDLEGVVQALANTNIDLLNKIEAQNHDLIAKNDRLEVVISALCMEVDNLRADNNKLKTENTRLGGKMRLMRGEDPA